MQGLTKAALAVASIGLVASGAAVATAAADSPEQGKASWGAKAAKPRVWAAVNSNGSKVRGRGATNTAKLATGQYQVKFDRNINACGWSGTIGVPSNGGSVMGTMISVSALSRAKNGVFVETFTKDGVPVDRPFLILVICS